MRREESSWWQKFRWWIALIIAIVIAFTMGSILRIGEFDFEVDPNAEKLSRHDYYRLIISVFAALFTLLAIIVALFKEEIIALFRNSKLMVSKRDDDFLYEEIIQAEGGTKINEPHKASSYKIFLRVTNVGTLEAKRCSVKLRDVTFAPSLNNPSVPIDECRSTSLLWFRGIDAGNLIPVGDYEDILIAEVKPNEGSRPDQNQAQDPFLFIGGVKLGESFRQGYVRASILVYSEKSSPVNFILEINWNGQWHYRLTEMKKHLRVSEGKKR